MRSNGRGSWGQNDRGGEEVAGGEGTEEHVKYRDTLICVHLRAKVMIFQNSKIPNGPT